jgi:DNA adenine methylase
VRVPHPIPYQGSKRTLAPRILPYFPDRISRLIEPFAGSAAISLAAAYHHRATAFVLNDANVPLMRLWEQILTHPAEIAARYERIWHAQFADDDAYYNRIRDRFNATHQPEYLLFLLTRCVKAAVRYNADGAFNQSPDRRRRGTHPATMRAQIDRASALLRGGTTLRDGDYREAMADATPDDLVYLDPPYQGVGGHRDNRYIAVLTSERFIAQLRALNERVISYIVSYDGRTGNKRFGQPLPDDLGVQRIELDAGRSSQATLLGQRSVTYESLYLSPALVQRLKRESNRPER